MPSVEPQAPEGLKIKSKKGDATHSYSLNDGMLAIDVTWKQVPIRRMSLVATRAEAIELRDWLNKALAENVLFLQQTTAPQRP